MTLDRYMFRLWFAPFFGGSLFVMAIMLLARAMKLFATFSDLAQAWSLIAHLLLLTMPFFLLQVVPMAFFLALLNSITRLQQNSEMDAMRAAGISYSRMFRVFAVIGVVLWLGLTFTAMVLMPRAQLGFNNLLVNADTLKGAVSFVPQRITRGLDGFTVYVDGEDAQGDYHGLMLEDNRGGVPVTYLARSARFDQGGEFMYLNLKDGVRLEGEGANQRVLKFNSYQVSIPLAMARRRVLHSSDHVSMMTPRELWQSLHKPKDNLAVAEWNRRLILPTTVLVLLSFALPISLTRKRSGKAASLMVGVALLVAVYNLQLMFFQQTSQGSWPGWTMWVGQSLLLALGAWLSSRAMEDRLPAFFSRLSW